MTRLATHQANKAGRRVAIMQPYLLPYMGYYQLMAAAECFVIFDDVNYIKRGFINRNNMLLAGERHRFTLALHGASQNNLIKDIEIAGDPAELVRKFAHAYAKAPFAGEGLAIIEEAFAFEGRNLADFLSHSLRVLAKHLGLKTEIVRASKLDYDRTLRGQDKITALAQQLGASDYINLPGGEALYDGAQFAEMGLSLHFIEPSTFHYAQIGTSDFIPSLSIVDWLMHLPLETVQSEAQSPKTVLAEAKQ